MCCAVYVQKGPVRESVPGMEYATKIKRSDVPLEFACAAFGEAPVIAPPINPCHIWVRSQIEKEWKVEGSPNPINSNNHFHVQ